MQNVYNSKDVNEFVTRINKLTPESKPEWGKMSADQMFAHINVAYEMALEDKHTKPGKFKTFIIKTLFKNIVVSEKPFKRNMKTPPEFLMVNKKEFDKEKARLINYLNKVLELGGDYFHGKESHGMGNLTKTEWNNMFAKHLDHHLKQFGV